MLVRQVLFNLVREVPLRLAVHSNLLDPPAVTWYEQGSKPPILSASFSSHFLSFSCISWISVYLYILSTIFSVSSNDSFLPALLNFLRFFVAF